MRGLVGGGGGRWGPRRRDVEREEAGTIHRGLTVLDMFLSISVVSLFADGTDKPFQTKPIYSATESQSFRLSVKFLTDQPLGGGMVVVVVKVKFTLQQATKAHRGD